MKRFIRTGTILALCAIGSLLATSTAYASGCGQALVNYARTNTYQANYAVQRTVYYAEVVPTYVTLFQFVQPAVTTTTVTQQTTAVGVTGAALVLGAIAGHLVK